MVEAEESWRQETLGARLVELARRKDRRARFLGDLCHIWHVVWGRSEFRSRIVSLEIWGCIRLLFQDSGQGGT